MKRIFSLLAGCLACLGAIAQSPLVARFSLTGTIAGASEGQTIYLAQPMGRQLMPVDSAKIIGGKFTFAGRTDNGAHLMFVVAVEKGDIKTCGAILVEEGDLKATITDGFSANVTMPGCADFARWQKVNNADMLLASQIQSIVQKAQAGKIDNMRARRQLDSLSNVRLSSIVQFIQSDMPSRVSDLVFEQHEAQMPVQVRNYLLNEMTAKSVNLPGYLRVRKRLEAEAQQARAQERAAVGSDFSDFTLVGMDGKEVHLADIVKKNKLTLLDFWASWCGPCRAEMPHVCQAYDAFHYQGLEIVGVSLDNRREAWEKAVKDLGMDWIHVSDLKGWGSDIAALYGVHSIPSCFLIGPDGKIIAKDLRGDALIKTISSLISK